MYKDHGEADGGVIPARGGDTTSVTPGSSSDEQTLHLPGREIRSPAGASPCGMPRVRQGVQGEVTPAQRHPFRSSAGGRKSEFFTSLFTKGSVWLPGKRGRGVVLSRSHPAAAPRVPLRHPPGLPGHAATQRWLWAKSWLCTPNRFRGDLWAQRGNGLTSAAAQSRSCPQDPCHPKMSWGLCTGGADAPGKLGLVPSAARQPAAVRGELKTRSAPKVAAVGNGCSPGEPRSVRCVVSELEKNRLIEMWSL